MRDHRQPVGEPFVDIVSHILGTIRADVVAEGHPGGHDQMLRAEIHGEQFEKLVKSDAKVASKFLVGILREVGAVTRASSAQIKKILSAARK